MEGNTSFYDLLKENYRKKKGVDVVKLKRENMWKKIKTFLKCLSKQELISDAIDIITEIRNILESEDYFEEYDVTDTDLDLILVIKAIILCSARRWQEAEELLYHLTEKYEEAIFYALLGFVKNKTKIFTCSRDTLFVAQLQLKPSQSKPFRFEEIDIAVSNLTSAELRNAVQIMMAYTKEMKELPVSCMKMEYCIEIDLCNVNGNGYINIGKVIRNTIFPIIRDQIDSMLRVKEPKIISRNLVVDKGTQTDSIKNNMVECQTTQTEIISRNKAVQAEVITTAHKLIQASLEQPPSKKSKELSTVKATLNTVTKENVSLKIQIKTINEKFKSLQADYNNKVFALEQQVRTARTSVQLREQRHFEWQSNTKRLLEKIFDEVYVVQKTMCEDATIKYDTIDAVIVALRDELEELGLKKELDASVKEAAALRNGAINLETEITRRYQHIKELIVSNQLDKLLHVPLINSVVSEPPTVLLNFVSKLIPMCRNNRAYTAELRPNGQPPELSYRDAVHLSDFPPIVNFRKRKQQQRIVDKAMFDTYIEEVQNRLPNCSRQEIMRCVNAIKCQRNVPLGDIRIEDIVDLLNSSVVTVRQTVNSNTPGPSNRPDISFFWSEDSEVEQTEKICPICLDSCNADVTSLECQHSYHSMCIQEWLNTNNQCPICRHVTSVEVFEV